MDNYKTTQELLASKGLTAEQSLHILDSIEKNNDYTEMLLKECSGYPTIYNIVANLLYKNFELRGAELTLICTYIVIMIVKNFPDLAKEVANDT